MRPQFAAAALTLAVASVACRDSSRPVPVASIEVAPSLTDVRAGRTRQLVATPKDASGQALMGRTITWGSNNSSIAQVSSTGLVTGVGNGTVTITATSEGQSDMAQVVSWIGVTGSWQGTVAPVGQLPCAMTQSISEDTEGIITGRGTLVVPCMVSSWDVAGANHAGGVPDSVLTAWSGTGGFTLSGTFDGVDRMLVEITGGSFGCAVIPCPVTFTRTTFVPTAPPAPAARADAASSSRGPLGVTLGRD